MEGEGQPAIDGSFLAAVGNFIVVTAGYRVGVFGFLSSGELCCWLGPLTEGGSVSVKCAALSGLPTPAAELLTERILAQSPEPTAGLTPTQEDSSCLSRRDMCLSLFQLHHEFYLMLGMRGPGERGREPRARRG